ncbi:MAG: transposase [Opitutaceae bacterium]|nr:transposase [Opitutaceae bacterium]
MVEPPGWHSRGYLPHFDNGRSLQAVTYRLADALPAAVVLRLEEQSIDQAAHRAEIERFIDAGHGCCLLRRAENARLVVANWRHFDGLRYQLHAWVVMPNHVHVLIEPIANHSLSEIVQSWKSYTAKALLRHDAGQRPALPTSSRVWQADYWDRFIRDERHYRATVDYIHQNPVHAGLCANAEDWPWSSLGARADGPQD